MNATCTYCQKTIKATASYSRTALLGRRMHNACEVKLSRDHMAAVKAGLGHFDNGRFVAHTAEVK